MTTPYYPTRKAFIKSEGATCKNWTWSWSFVNHQERKIIFGAWDIHIIGESFTHPQRGLGNREWASQSWLPAERRASQAVMSIETLKECLAEARRQRGALS